MVNSGVEVANELHIIIIHSQTTHNVTVKRYVFHIL